MNGQYRTPLTRAELRDLLALAATAHRQPQIRESKRPDCRKYIYLFLSLFLILPASWFLGSVIGTASITSVSSTPSESSICIGSCDSFMGNWFNPRYSHWTRDSPEGWLRQWHFGNEGGHTYTTRELMGRKI